MCLVNSLFYVKIWVECLKVASYRAEAESAEDTFVELAAEEAAPEFDEWVLEQEVEAPTTSSVEAITATEQGKPRCMLPSYFR